MPRRRGPHGRNDSTVVAVRLPNDVAQQVQAEGPEWHRNVLRRALRIPIDYSAGYEEGKAAGWTEAQARLRNALRGA